MEDSGFNQGDGRSTDSPYLICTYAQLAMIDDDLSAHYQLGDNIDASVSWSEGADACTAYDGTTIPATNACTGWTPLGGVEGTNNFSGSLNGDNYVIRNLYINAAHTTHIYVGLFAWTNMNAEISNVGLTDCEIQASIGSGTARTGGLVGWQDGSATITDSYVKGVISCLAPLNRCGGLVGLNDRNATITNSYAAASVSIPMATGSVYGGGLVGENADGATITNSYATGKVSIMGTRSSNGGGLVGLNANSATITNSYTTGGVSLSDSSTAGTLNSGGLVGQNGSSVAITNSYAAGLVSVSGGGLRRQAGLVGLNTGIVNNTCYWDAERTMQSNACLGSGTCSAVGLTTDEMQAVPPETTYPDALGAAFQLNDGEDPKVYKQGSTTELVPGQ